MTTETAQERKREKYETTFDTITSNGVITVEPLHKERITSLQLTHYLPPFLYIVHTFLPPKKGQPLNNMLIPNVSIIKRFHCIWIIGG